MTIGSGATARVEVPVGRSRQVTLALELPVGRPGRSRELWLEFRAPTGAVRLERFWSVQNGISECCLNLPVPAEELVVYARVLSEGVLLGSSRAALPAAAKSSPGEAVLLAVERTRPVDTD